MIQYFKKLFSLNRVILIIISGEFMLTTAFGLMVPIFSIFIVEEITAGTAQVVGFSIAIYWIVKSILQLPIAQWLDKNHGEYDDFWALVGGQVAGATLAFFFYFYAKEVWHIYVFQALWGITDAVLVPPFYAIFTRHIDPGHEGLEWSLRSSISFGAGSAAGGALGGFIAGALGLREVFLFVGVGALIGSAILLFLKPYMKPRVTPPEQRIFIEQKRL